MLMSKLGHLAILALISIPFFGCSATGELFKPAQQSPGLAQVYIYRTPGAAASGMAEHIFLDGKEVVELAPGGYYFTPVTPGEHTISAKMLMQMFREKQEISIRLVAETEKIYYVRVGAALTFFSGVYNEITRRIEIIDEEKALPELSTMRLQQRPKEQ